VQGQAKMKGSLPYTSLLLLESGLQLSFLISYVSFLSACQNHDGVFLLILEL
jgi:hypothetical protein